VYTATHIYTNSNSIPHPNPNSKLTFMMLDICSQEANLLDFTFNTVKSMAMRIGPRYKYSCMPLVLNGSELAYVEQIK